MRIGLVYEDESINIAFQVIARRVLQAPVEFEPLEGGSWPGIVGLTPNLLQVLSITHGWNPLDCVFVVFDSNSAAIGSRSLKVRNKVGNRVFSFGAPVYHSIIRQVETWLLGDHQALCAVAQTQALPIVQDPEALVDPKRHIIQQLKNHSHVPYSRTFVRSVLDVADFDVVAQRCPDFSLFRDELLRCQAPQIAPP